MGLVGFSGVTLSLAESTDINGATRVSPTHSPRHQDTLHTTMPISSLL